VKKRNIKSLKLSKKTISTIRMGIGRDLTNPRYCDYSTYLGDCDNLCLLSRDGNDNSCFGGETCRTCDCY
jgi:hypothetical protein